MGGLFCFNFLNDKVNSEQSTPIGYNDRQLTLMRSVGLCERAFALSCMLPVCGGIVGSQL